MRRFFGTLSTGLFLVSLAGCGNGGVSGGGGGGSGGSGGAPPAAPTFAEVYNDVLHAHGCAGSYCHAGEGAQATYSDLVGKPATGMGCEGQVLVVPGDPEHSLVYLKVTMTQPPCGKQMPMGGAPLPADQVEMLRAWIAAGAPE